MTTTQRKIAGDGFALTAEQKFNGFTYPELRAAFELVQNKDHWKNPIDSTCTSEEIKIVANAIIYFTATKATFDYLTQLEVDRERFKAGDFIFKV